MIVLSPADIIVELHDYLAGSQKTRMYVTVDWIIHGKRGTIAVIVKPDGSLTVRAPLRTSEKAIGSLSKIMHNGLREKGQKFGKSFFHRPNSIFPARYLCI